MLHFYQNVTYNYFFITFFGELPDANGAEAIEYSRIKMCLFFVSPINIPEAALYICHISCFSFLYLSSDIIRDLSSQYDTH